MKKLLVGSSIICAALCGTSLEAYKWTIGTFIQADNNLADFALYNITDMTKGMVSDDDVAMVVQWDKPEDRKTWRYQVTSNGKIENDSLSSEMGTNPQAEVTAFGQWMHNEYPADNYGMILWNHGSGIEDFRSPIEKIVKSWIEIPGLSKKTTSSSLRGILYDDSQSTCLTNQGLTQAMIDIKRILGKNLGFLGMDACLMAMLEVAYQIKGCVDVFVGSQETEPGWGWAYAGWLHPLTSNPDMTAAQIGEAIVNSYNNFYANDGERDYTQSAINMTSIPGLKSNIDTFVTAINVCKKSNAKDIAARIKAARKASLEFEMPEYIDLYSFYSALARGISKSTPKSARILDKNKKPVKPLSKDYRDSLAALKNVLTDGMNKISAAVIANAKGPECANAHGISIYFPKSGPIDESYLNTLFAKETAWVSFVKENKSK